MKKAEAISILATSVRPREAKDRARYDEAVRMAIEALKCSETPKSSEQNAETAQSDHNADIGKKADGDCISRQAAIDCVTYDVEHTIGCLKALPSAAPSTTQTTNTTAPSTVDWIPVERELPEDLAEVNVTWVNHEPEPYYEPIKSKPFTASAVYYEGNWYWYSSVCADVLAEYGRNDVDKVDDTIEITAWKPLPEPYRGGDSE